MSIHQPPESDMGINVTSPIAVDPRIVDINLLSEAMGRIIGSLGTLMQILHATDATEQDRVYASKMLDAMVERVIFEFRPLYKDSLNAVKH